MFEKTVGIKERRWAEDHVTSSDLGFQAAEQLFESGINKEDIGCVVFLSQTPDFIIPFTSNILQARLGIGKDVLCLDISAGCAGFVQGLSMAYAITQTLVGRKTLFIVAETLSKILSTEDRSTTMLFGDGAAALVIKKTNSNQKALFNFFSDGFNQDAIMIPDGGFRNMVTCGSLDKYADDKGNKRSRANLYMDGSRVLDFTLREVAPSIAQLLAESGVTIADIDYALFHQSNRFIIKQIASQVGLGQNKVLVNIEQFGNTSGVSIPLLFSTFSSEICEAKRILLSGYGSGLNWANCILDVGALEILPLKEYQN